jgi:hypothetical protein
MQQDAGGYDAHRANKGRTFKSATHGGVPASMNLHGNGDAAASRRDAWLKEVQAIKRDRNITLKEAFKIASERRAADNPAYKTVKLRRLRGRQAEAVKCEPGKSCPGAYTRAPEPYAARSHRPLTQAAAKKVLREFYRTHSLKTGSMKTSTKAMRQNISRTRADAVPLQPCPTKTITYVRAGRQVTRRVIDREAAKRAGCLDNWVFRNSGVQRHKFATVTGLTENRYSGKRSPAYGRRVMRKLETMQAN